MCAVGVSFLFVGARACCGKFISEDIMLLTLCVSETFS